MFAKIVVLMSCRLVALSQISNIIIAMNRVDVNMVSDPKNARCLNDPIQSWKTPKNKLAVSEKVVNTPAFLEDLNILKAIQKNNADIPVKRKNRNNK